MPAVAQERVRDGPAVRVHRAFTLVELLVVIGIIALLVGIVVPVLGRARRSSDAAVCAGNMRQLYVVSLMFCNDNKGHLPRPHQVGDLSNDPALTGVCAWTHVAANAAGHADVRDESGVLWKYVRGVDARQSLILCPGDKGEAVEGWPVDPARPRNFSYSMNVRVCQAADRARRPGGAVKIGIKLARVSRPSDRIMWYEELAPNDTACIISNIADIPTARHGSREALNAFPRSPTNLAYSYNGRGNMCFFDGHVASVSPYELLHPITGVGYHGPLMEGE
jgi:prepilin-type N-terminal cleavage/methylation domain-containing protein/prepilin-type processing-associated H-X9-DG protein